MAVSWPAAVMATQQQVVLVSPDHSGQTRSVGEWGRIMGGYRGGDYTPASQRFPLPQTAGARTNPGENGNNYG